MPQKNLYATLIGINNYPQNPLAGCVHDALAMDNFLRNLCRQQTADASLTYHPSYFLGHGEEEMPLLKNHAEKNWNFDLKTYQAPTFQNLTTAAFDHLKQAKDGDICLFYYSGHGSTIQAPEAFKGHKSKLQNETIVCVDSRTGARDLIDKEIAWLLWNALEGKNVHCLVIMDCCFAGNNTRAIQADTQIRYRHAADSNRPIPLEEYLGYSQGFYTPNRAGGVDIKIGRYVQLAASMDHQTAQETASSGGLFTSQLLEVLQKGGSARSYRDLMQTTRVSVRNRNPNQTPVEFAAVDQDMDQPFLGGDIIPYKPAFELRFDADYKTWVLHGGAMDGLVSSPGNPTKVRVLGADKEFSIKAIFSNFSYLDAAPEDLDTARDDNYQAVVSKYATPLLQVCVSDSLLADAVRLDGLKTAYGHGSEFPYISLYFEKGKQDAPYQIHLTEDDQYVLLRTGNTIPLFKRESEPRSFLTSVNCVGKWLVAGDLKNTDTNFSKEDFIFKLERIEGKKLTPKNLDEVDAEWINEDGYLPEEVVFSYKNGQQPAFRLSIAINPNSRHLESCYVGVLYLDSKYGIRSDLIKSDANALAKKGSPISLSFSIDGFNYSTTPLSVDKNYYLFGINEIMSQLKIVVSKEPINLDKYRQESLTLEDVPLRSTRSVKSTRAGRGDLFLENEADTPDRNDWCVFSTRFRIVGPHKNVALSGGSTADLSAFEIESPEGFDALAYAGTGDDVAKKLAEIRHAKSSESTHAIAPPPDLFGAANTLDQPFPAGLSGVSNNSVQVLELRAREEGSLPVLPPGTTIRIKPKNSMGVHETIVPFGYDEQSGLFFSVGYTDGAGTVHIEQLPPPSSLTIEDRRLEKEKSLGGSIKLFFQKVAWSRITGIKEYDRLSLHRKDTTGALSEIAYLGSQRTLAKAAQIKQALGNGNTLLLMHGIIGDTKEMVESVFEREALYQPFVGVLTYDYENLTSGIEATAQKLKQMLIDCGFGDEKRLTIVAHSMGGLVSRYLIEHLEGDRFVKKLIQCGTPNSGSEMADFRRKLTGWLAAGMNGVMLFQPYMPVASFLGRRLEKGLFRTLDEMDPDSDFMAKLNASGKSSPEVPYYLIGGDTSQIEVIFPEDTSLIKKIFALLSTHGIYQGLDHAVFDKAPNDMAVKVERMKDLPWGRHHDTQILKCDHVSYFTNTDSLGQIEGWIE